MKLVDDGVLKLGKTQSQSAPPHRAVHAAPLPSPPPRRALDYRAACQASVPPRDQAMQRLWSRYIALTLQPKLRQRLLPPRAAPRCRHHHHQSHAVPNSSITNCARALLEIMGSQSTALPTWGTVCWQSNTYFKFQCSKGKFMRLSISFVFFSSHIFLRELIAQENASLKE